MRKLVLVSIAMNTLLLIGVVALTVMVFNVKQGEPGATATNEQLKNAAAAVAPTTEAVAEKVVPYEKRAEGFAKSSSASANETKQAQTATKALKEEAESIKSKIEMSVIVAEKAAADAKASKQAVEEAKKAIEVSLVEAKKIEENAKEVMRKIKDSLIVPHMLKRTDSKSTVNGEFDLKKGTIEIELPSADIRNRLTTHVKNNVRSDRNKVILLEHNENFSRCISVCKDAIYDADPNKIKIKVPITFLETIEKVVGSTSIIVMFGTPDDAKWTYAKINIRLKP